VRSYLGEETVLGLASSLPKLKAKIPELLVKYGPYLDSMLKGAIPPALQAQPVHHPAPVVQHAPRSPKRSATNGAATAPPAPLTDEHSPRVE
jgi:hypothetical protein